MPEWIKLQTEITKETKQRLDKVVKLKKTTIAYTVNEAVNMFLDAKGEK
jgi:predicted DNA-binding protein